MITLCIKVKPGSFKAEITFDIQNRERDRPSAELSHTTFFGSLTEC
jgi:hypothetical protein